MNTDPPIIHLPHSDLAPMSCPNPSSCNLATIQYLRFCSVYHCCSQTAILHGRRASGQLEPPPTTFST